MSFFDRWAKLKREADAAKAAEAAKPAEAGVEAAGEGPAAAPPADGVAPAVEAPQVAEVGEAPPLPSLEDVVPGGDLKAFFGEHVPEALRQAAMRRMWAADPAIRDFVSEACDYAWDWNVPGGAPGCGPIDPSEIGDFVARLYGEPVAKEPAKAAEPAEVAAEAAGDVIEPSRDQTSQGTDHPEEYVSGADAAVQQKGASRPVITKDIGEASEVERLSLSSLPDESNTWNRSELPDPNSAILPQARRHGGALPR